MSWIKEEGYLQLCYISIQRCTPAVSKSLSNGPAGGVLAILIAWQREGGTKKIRLWKRGHQIVQVQQLDIGRLDNVCKSNIRYVELQSQPKCSKLTVLLQHPR